MSEHDLSDRQVLRLASERWAVARQVSAPRTPGELALDRVSCRLGDASCASSHAARVSRMSSGSDGSLHRSLLRLQRQYGNRYVGHVLRQASGVDSEGAGMDAVERSIDGARGGGQGMDHGTRGRMESAFGADFSGVRIHTDSRAADLSQSLSARAFTTGRDVFFGQGEYSPGTSSGRELLAHELTHVVQQNGDAVKRKMTVSEPGDAHELEADEMARAVMAQEHGPAVARQPEAPKLADEEEKKRLHTKADPSSLARLRDDEDMPQ
ncbi:MAG: hypothetical protein JWP52_401 [Rhizobacter sp.]|jgi:hypothetical protein|nr:hypothetical protein [Rhizobacter sp.]